jgi:5-formyltetrahydrofolate cyclo-ligase
MTSGAEAKRKASLRQQALAHRDALSAEARAAASAVIAGRAGELLDSLGPASVALYRAIRSECETQSLIERLWATGVETGLPAVVDSDTLVFRHYGPGDQTVAAAFGTREPRPSARPIVPDLIVTPVVGFDRAGMRLGYGRGYYDFAINRLRDAGQRPRLVGLAFSVQEVETIPAESHDVRLDFVVTEEETLEFRG